MVFPLSVVPIVMTPAPRPTTSAKVALNRVVTIKLSSRQVMRPPIGRQWSRTVKLMVGKVLLVIDRLLFSYPKLLPRVAATFLIKFRLNVRVRKIGTTWDNT